MKKYQIEEIAGEFNHAGSKATADVACIAESIGYKRIPIRMNTTKYSKAAKIQRQIGYFIDWEMAYRMIENNSVVLLQHPFHYRQFTREKILLKLKQSKKVKFICLIHDMEELRKSRYNEYYKREFEFMLQIADVLIAHNSVMKQCLEDCGVTEEKIVCLEIFDYLQDGDISRMPAFEKSITVAGNLDVFKSAYIGQLNQLTSIKVRLYGSNFDQKMASYENVQYFGSFPPKEIPFKLTSGFGLVWDGDDISTCSGNTGNYLRYNNPHKLSLYLSSGLPVVIWKGAAEARMVHEYGLGLCVDSLQELQDVFEEFTEKDYQKLVHNVIEFAGKLRTGWYAKQALLKAEEILQKEL